MPRIKPEYYADLEPSHRLDIAVGMNDPTATWALIKSGLQPNSGHLYGITTNNFSLEPVSDLPLKAPPGGPRGYNRQLAKLARILFQAGANPLERVSLPNNVDSNLGTIHILPAQAAFICQPHEDKKPALGALSIVVLETLKVKPDWRPDFNHIFRNIIEIDPASESEHRLAQAGHIYALGHTVMGRLRSARICQEDKLAVAASAALSGTNGNSRWWDDPDNWSINPKTMPQPTVAMRSAHKADYERTLAVSLARLKGRPGLG